MENKYITLAYKLYAPMEGNDKELIEEATTEVPFQFVSGMGMALDAFEAQITPLEVGATFNFTLDVDDAYGPHMAEGVQQLPISAFEINGKIDKKYIYEGAVIPMQNAEGERFNATITEMTAQQVTIDLNHPLAGKPLTFVGTVLESREATKEEMQDAVNALTGGCGGCGGGNKCGGGCNGGCCGGCN
ncbi:MAG: peptidylprolyl isomerase [Bacteroidaceae bacterium]|nr:peptidylprolyl isomerase [Bacteroidaceae bacterium]